METSNLPVIRALRPAWNKGRIVGQKRPLKPKHVWVIRIRLELAKNHRDLALFNLAIDSKLRGYDLVKAKVVDVMASDRIKERASVLQSKTQKPVHFEISEGTRAFLDRWMQDPLMAGSEYLCLAGFMNGFTSRPANMCELSGNGLLRSAWRQALWHTLSTSDMAPCADSCGAERQRAFEGERNAEWLGLHKGEGLHTGTGVGEPTRVCASSGLAPVQRPSQGRLARPAVRLCPPAPRSDAGVRP